MKTILSLLLLFTLHTATAQSWQWGTSGGSNANTTVQNRETIIDMATDVNANIYIVTHVDASGSVTIAGNPVTTYAYRDILVASFNCNGGLRWTKTLGGSQDETVRAIAVDNEGGVYITGQMGNGTKHFSTDTVQPGSSGGFNKLFFLIKYDSSGNYQWLRQPMPDTVDVLRRSHYYSLDMVADPIGGVYMLCHLGTGIIDGSSYTITTPGIYMLHYNAQGNITELTPMDMEINLDAPPSGLKFRLNRMSSGKFIIGGSINLSADTSASPLFIAGQQITKTLFIFCFNANGTYLWKIQNSNPPPLSGGTGGRLAINENSEIVFPLSAVVGESIGGVPATNNNGSYFVTDGIMKADTLGNITGFKFGEEINARCMSSGVAATTNKVHLVGSYALKIKFDGFSLNNPANNGYKAFIATFDNQNFNTLNLDSIKGSTGSNDYVTTAIADNKGNVYIGGNMNSQMYVNGQTLTSNGGDNDFFIAKYGSADCSSVVPVNITYFHANLNNKTVYLQWQTANEINVSHFNIQRSTNGTEFTTIGKTNAMGNGNNSYNYTDNDAVSVIPPLGVRGLYYRLQNIDKDGSYTYSKIENIQLPTFNTQLSIYPNPTRNIVNVVSKNIQQINIIDFTGRILIQQNFNNANNVKLNIANLSKGIYLLKVVDIKGNVQTKKLIVE